MARRARETICMVVLFALSALAAGAQSSGFVTFDGAAVPGATVTATQGTKKIAATTGADGSYTISGLSGGACTLSVHMTGFVPLQQQVTLAPGMAPLHWELKLLPLSRIHAAAAAREAALPSAPAARASAGEASPSTPDSGEPTEPAAAQGLLINGSESNAASSAFAQPMAFGNQRRGHSLYNGNLGLQIGNSALDARQYSLTGLDTPKPSYSFVSGSVAFGGPLRIPHLRAAPAKFSVNYQWTRDHDATTQSNTVPTAAEREGDFSQAIDPAGKPIVIYDPATGRPFPNNKLPAINPQARALLNFYPLPSVLHGTRYNYQAPFLSSSHQDALQARVSESFRSGNQAWGNFRFLSARSSTPNLFGFVDRGANLGLLTSLSWQHHFSLQTYGALGYSFSRYRLRATPFFANRRNVSGDAGITGNNQEPANWGPPSLSFSSILALADGQSAFNRNETNRLSYSMTWIRERHTFTLGGDFRRQEFNVFSQQDPRGTFTFTGAATRGIVNGAPVGGSDLADFMLGTPDTSSIAFGNPDKYFRQSVYDAYFDDDWRLSPGFSANLGIRWEYGAPITELFGRLVNLDLAPGFTAAAPVVAQSPVGTVTGTKYPRSLLWPDRNGFEPRVGIAWRPLPASSLVVRLGYGIYRDTTMYETIANDMAQQAPLSKSLRVENSAICPLTLADGFLPCSATTRNTFAVDPHLHTGYAQVWDLSAERDLPGSLHLTVIYSGVKGTHDLQEILPNTFPLGGTSPCPGCPVGFAYLTSGGNSTRQAGIVELRRRLHNGLTATVAYTYSKSIDDAAVLGGQGADTPQSGSANSNPSGDTGMEMPTPSGLAIAQNWLDPGAERSLSSFDQRHLLSATLAYTTGMGLKGGTLLGGWRGALYKDWTFFTQITAGSGLPQTPIYLSAAPLTGFTGTIRPDSTGAPLYAAPPGYFLNPAAYAAPGPGRWGAAGRNSISGPRQLQMNASLGRTFRLTSEYSLDLRVDATNMLNHLTFSGWNTTIESGQFGLPASADPMRRMRMTVRFRF